MNKFSFIKKGLSIIGIIIFSIIVVGTLFIFLFPRKEKFTHYVCKSYQVESENRKVGIDCGQYTCECNGKLNRIGIDATCEGNIQNCKFVGKVRSDRELIL